MTIAPPSETAVADALDIEGPEDEPEGLSSDQLRRGALQVLVVLVALALVVVAFETLVTKKYFQVRQGQMFSTWTQAIPRARTGDPIAILQIPRATSSVGSTALNLNLVVVQGDGAAQLHGAPGHVPWSPAPGRRGNSIILAHRSGWGGPFGDLAQVHKGALILTQTHGSRTATVYKVTTIAHVSAADRRYSAPSKDFRLTLVTGDGGSLSNDRLVIQAVSGSSLASSRARGPVVSVPHGSLWLNPAVAVAFGAFLLAAIAYDYLRRRYGLLARLAVLVPLLTAGLFAVLLELDLFLPPLR